MKDYIYVACGGFLGAIIRYLIALLESPTSFFPLTTFIINLSGSFLLSLLYSYPMTKNYTTSRLQLFLGVGFLGAYTTFSTFSLETLRLLKNQHQLIAIVYSLGSSLGGIFCAICGLWLGEKIKYYRQKQTLSNNYRH